MVSWWKVIFHTFTQRRLAIEKHILIAMIRMDAANGHHQQKSILFLHHIWPQRSLFESRVIPSAKRTSIREKICRKYWFSRKQSHFNETSIFIELIEFFQTGWGVFGRFEEDSRARGVRLCQLFLLTTRSQFLQTCVNIKICIFSNDFKMCLHPGLQTSMLDLHFLASRQTFPGGVSKVSAECLLPE